MKQKNVFFKLFSFMLVLLMLVTNSGLLSANAADAGWTVSNDTEIFLITTDEYDEDLQSQVKLFAAELAEKVTGNVLPISYGEDNRAGNNDIILALDPDAQIAADGFDIKVSGSEIKISASDADGLFYGCRHLIKELLLDGTVADCSDAPDVAERAVSLDNGRKYFTVAWIKELIREMSWANMNTLVLHFSEDMGFGIESKLYPWLAGRNGRLCVQANLGEDYDGRYLTQEEVVEILEYAKLYHIDVIPSLDSPGHMNYIVKKISEKTASADFTFTYDEVEYTIPKGTGIGNYFKYGSATTSCVPGSSVPKDEYALSTSRGIDISNEAAVAFTKSLIEEYAKLFADHGCTKFDIGGDELLGWGTPVVSTSKASRWQQLDHWKEYAQDKTGNSNAVAYDAFLLYMNDLNDLVTSHGYTGVRMWNDDALRISDTGWTGVVQLNSNIDIWYWTTGTNPFSTYADYGYEMYNILGDYNYYVLTNNYLNDTRGSDFAHAYADEIYEDWSPYVFSISGEPVEDTENVLGGAFGVWCDNPSLRTEDEMMVEMLPLIRANAAKSWDVNANTTLNYSTYTNNWTKYGAAPNPVVGSESIYEWPDLSLLTAAVNDSASVDGSLYTENSYAAYMAAVEAGRQVLESAKPSQVDVENAVDAIVTAKAQLAERSIVDTTDLEEAIAKYESLDPAMYTADTFPVYQQAAEEAKALLSSGNYSEADVADALKKLNGAFALLESSVDTEALETAIAELETVDPSVYTEESYDLYKALVNKAKTMLASNVYTQDQADKALADINTAKTRLRNVDAIADISCFISGDFRSNRVDAGRTAVLGINVTKESNVVGFEIYNDANTLVKIGRMMVNRKKPDRDNWQLMFTVTEEEVSDEPQVYRVYAVLKDENGNELVSTEYLELSIIVNKFKY